MGYKAKIISPLTTEKGTLSHLRHGMVHVVQQLDLVLRNSGDLYMQDMMDGFQTCKDTHNLSRSGQRL